MVQMQGRIIKRLLGHPSNDNHAEHAHINESRVDAAALLRPTCSQNAQFNVRSSLTCVEKSPTGDYAVVAGDEVFKTIKISGNSISEGLDLRAAFGNRPSNNEHKATNFNDHLHIKSVKWSHGELSTIVATASANGRVTLYDINRPAGNVEVGRIREHTRQVHKLAFNPWRGNWLLTACHDGNARLFDVKQATSGRPGQVFSSWMGFACNADSVRDIQWCPTDGFKFACSTASGNVLHWDTRKSSVPLLKINKAHDSACLSISWHPDGKHLISGGLDQRCYVWDLSENADRRQKAKYTIATPAPVSIVSWRPPCWSSTAQAKRAAQVAVVYDDVNPMKTQHSTVHIWDIARPAMAFKELTCFETSPTGILWHERDLLWAVGREGAFTQADVAFAPKVIDNRSLSTFAFSPAGDIVMLLEERQGRTRPRPHMGGTVLVDSPGQSGGTTESNSQSPGVGHLSLSRSDSEEDISGSFLGPSHPLSRSSSHRGGATTPGALSTTPPSLSHFDGDIMVLDEAVRLTGLYKPQQVMAVGHAPCAAREDGFKYLAGHYLLRLQRDLEDTRTSRQKVSPMPARLDSILGSFAKYAERVGKFRLAQTWRIVAYTMGILLERRGEHHKGQRLKGWECKKAGREKEERKAQKQSDRRPSHLDDDTPRKSPQTKPSKDNLAQSIIKSAAPDEFESTSNVTTPLARAMNDSMIFEPTTSKLMSRIDNDALELPPPSHRSASPMKIPERDSPKARQDSFDGPSSSVDGYDFYDTSSFETAAIDIATQSRRSRLRSGQGLGSISNQSRITRHDSNESLQMFSTSADSQAGHLSRSRPDRGSLSNLSLPPQSIPADELSWDSSATSSNLQPNTSFESRSSMQTSTDESEEGYGQQPTNDLEASEMTLLVPTTRVQRPAQSASAFADAHLNLNINEDEESSPSTITTDYLPHHSDPPFLATPIDPHDFIPKLLQFELETNTLTPSILILLLKPFLLPHTLNDLQCTAILRELHSKLDRMSLFEEATLLRNLCYPSYPAVYGQGLPKHLGSMGYFCNTCGKAVSEGEGLSVGERMVKCHRCRGYFSGCAVCAEVEEPPPLFPSESGGSLEGSGRDLSIIDPSSPAASLWWYCQGCGHGGHIACLDAWHSNSGTDFSDGCCPLEGCLHPCLPGVWREEFFSRRNLAASEEVSRAVKDATAGAKGVAGQQGLRPVSVRRDRKEVRESNAVGSVRGALAQGGSGGAVEGGRRKSVKVVAPGDK